MGLCADFVLMSKITVSPAAQAYLRSIIEKQKMPGLAIRLSVTNPGTPGVESGILYCPKEYITTNDLHFKMEGFEIVIDLNVADFLDETTLDMGKDDSGADVLTFHAPNLKRKLVSDDAPLKDQIAYFIERFVSPTLAGHGGAVRFVNITDDGIVQVEFSGGCNGCSLASATLHEGIEKQLKNAFQDQIKGVEDVTNHQATAETYAQ